MAYAHISANTSGKQIQKGTTQLCRIVVGKAGSADWTVTLYNGTDTNGDVISINDLTSGGNYEYCTILSDGLYVTASGTTAGDITIVYE